MNFSRKDEENIRVLQEMLENRRDIQEEDMPSPLKAKSRITGSIEDMTGSSYSLEKKTNNKKLKRISMNQSSFREGMFLEVKTLLILI